MSYIDKEKALEFVLNNTPHINGETTMKCVERAIKEIPNADVVAVVRCKDCKHSVKYNCKNDACYQFTMCRRREHYSEGVEEDDYCSYGERKEG